MTQTARASAEHASLGRGHSESVIEKVCKLASALALVVLLLAVGVDIVTRWAFNFSFEVSDELGGYMLIAIAFLSLPVSHINDAFHRVEFVQARLSPRVQLLSRFVFDLTALVFCALFVWQFIGLVRSSWRFGDHAPTFLETPLWIPRSLLVIGMAALCLSLARSLAANLRRLCTGSRRRDEP